MPTEKQIEAAAKAIANWCGYSWEGLNDRDISDNYPDWVNSSFGREPQGGKPGFRRAARTALEAAEKVK